MKAWDLHTAIYDRLQAFGTLTALVGGRILDHVTQDETFPYVKIGEELVTTSWDTHDSKGSNNIVVLHVWSRYRGIKEVKDIQQAIYDALHQHSLTVSGADTITCEFDSANYVLDPDGLTRHGIGRYRVILDGVES